MTTSRHVFVHRVELPLAARLLELRTDIAPGQLDEGELDAGRGAWLAKLEVPRAEWEKLVSERLVRPAVS